MSDLIFGELTEANVEIDDVVRCKVRRLIRICTL